MSFTASLDEIVEANKNGLLGCHPSWSRARLREVAAILNGFPFESRHFTKNRGFPLLRIRDVRAKTTEALYDGNYEDTYLVRHGDLVVGMDGDFNCALWNGPIALLNQRVCKLTPREEYYSRRLLAYVLQGYLNAINDHTSSMTVKHLSSTTVGDIPLPLPPRVEQERVAESLDAYFTRLDTAVVTLERVKANLKRYRASVLKAAVEGRLVSTEEELARQEDQDYEPASVLLGRILKERRRCWEKAELAKLKARGVVPKDDGWKARYREPVVPSTTDLPALPEGWTWTTLDAIAEVKLGKMLSRKAFEGGLERRPYLRNENVRWGYLDLTDLAIMGFKYGEIDRYQVLPGDLMVCEGGEPGRCAVLQDHGVAGLMYQKALHRVRPFGGLVSNLFLQACLWHYVTSKIVVPRASETTIKHLPLERMMELRIPLPPSREQQRIVDEIDRLLSLANGTRQVVEADLQRVGRLRQSILKWAFEGKLVDQDPTDELASILLERIKAERENADNANHKTPRGGRKKVTA